MTQPTEQQPSKAAVLFDEIENIRFWGQTQNPGLVTWKISNAISTAFAAIDTETQSLREALTGAKKEISRAWGCDTSHVAQLAIVVSQREDLQRQLAESQERAAQAQAACVAKDEALQLTTQCCRTDLDLSDSYVMANHATPQIKARRIALRTGEAALAQQEQPAS